MAAPTPQSRSLGIVLLLAGVAVFMGFCGMGGWFGGVGEAPENHQPGPGQVDLLVRGERWIATDKDGDATVDCFLFPSPHPTFGTDVYAAKGVRCGGPTAISPHALPDDLRGVLSDLMRVKTAFGMPASVPLDVDGDGSADCVRHVFDGGKLLAQRPGAAVCPGRLVAHPGSPDWALVTEALALEKKAVALVPRG